MCLTHADQKHLLKKTGLLKKQDSPYDIHEKLVASLDSENRLSKRLDNLVERKFASQANALRVLDGQSFMDHFKDAMAAGDGDGALWAAGTHPHLSLECRREIFGDIHMTMHWSANERLKCYRKQTRQADELERLRQQVKRRIGEQRALAREIKDFRLAQRRLECDIAVLRQENWALKQDLFKRTDLNQLNALRVENQRLNDDCSSFSTKLSTALAKMAALEQKNHHLSMALDEQRDKNRQVCEQTRSIIGEMAALNHCDSNCPAYDLCQKRILIVGGITRMEAIYRDLIEGRGGRFDYHDGYVKKGARDLENRFKRADLVLCPVNCNSHAACSIVKNLGKKHNKPVFMLPNSSLSTVSQVIWGDDGEKSALN